jgi:DUF4097 and DUF4098 domain-containing protein YvlB
MNKLLSTALLLLAAAPALAADYRTPVKADVRVSVENLAGLIEVAGWDKTELVLDAELGEGVKDILTSLGDNSVSIKLDLDRSIRDTGESRLRLRVPHGARLDLNGVSADIVVSGVHGEVRAQSVSGDVNLDVGSAEIEAKSVSGDLNVRALKALRSRVSSVSGDIHVEGGREHLRVETVSGDLMIKADMLGEIQLKSVSGEIQLHAPLAPAARVNAESMSGNIVLSLPALNDAQLSLHSFSGELRSDFGERIPRGAKRHEMRLGSGKARVELHSFSGDVELRKR